ncbi:hypothetical protein [Phaeovulum vinaykumarii]|nr:hypothetical protein [Phaeovulum vinaykumarii]
MAALNEDAPNLKESFTVLAPEQNTITQDEVGPVHVPRLAADV